MHIKGGCTAKKKERDVGEETEIMKKPIKKGLSKKTVNKYKMKLPTGKMFNIGKTVNENSKLIELSKKDILTLIEESKKNVDEKWSEKYKKSIDVQQELAGKLLFKSKTGKVMVKPQLNT